MVQDSEDFTGTKEEILTGLNVTGSILSFLGCTFILITYYSTPSLQKLAFQLLLYVSIADMLSSFVNIWGDLPSDSVACQMQAFFSAWGRLASFFWVGFISVVMYGLVYDSERWDAMFVENMKKKAHWVIWPFSMILALLPFSTDSYGNTGGWCFINHAQASQIWAFISFYGWLWLVMCGSLALYWKLYSRINEINLRRASKSQSSDQPHAPSDQPQPTEKPTTDEETVGNEQGTIRGNTDRASAVGRQPSQEETSVSVKKQRRMLHMVRRMFFYPAVLFVCYFFPTVRRFWNFSGHDSPYAIVCLRVFTAALYGFGNSLIYAYTVWPKIRKEMVLCRRTEVTVKK